MVKKEKIVIIAAMDKEVALLLELMSHTCGRNVDNLHYEVGTIGDKEVAVVKCGIGKVNAAVNTYKIIRDFDPDLVINSGVAGGVDPKAGIGAVVVSAGVTYHDVWCGPGTERGAADGFPVILKPESSTLKIVERVGEEIPDFHTGLIVSGDIFVSEAKVVKEIKNNFPDALACDMESGAIAQVCAMEQIPFIIIRVLSDRPGSGDNLSEYRNFWSIAPERTFEVVRRFINAL